MLYLREDALSGYNGKEIVKTNFDAEFEIKKDKEREEVVQTIYFLTKHNKDFAIDYPIDTREIKNPDPDRFQRSYQVTSLAPVIPLDHLIGKNIGGEKLERSYLAELFRSSKERHTLSSNA